VKLADFGLACVYQDSKLSGLTLVGEIGGSIAYMAPEQITNFREAKPPVDQYGAAATLYHLLTNCPIHDWPEEINECLALILHKAPVSIRARRADVPVGLARVIHQALARDPHARFADVEAMRRALVPFAS
jgi:serine/threonine-protein kinase